MSWTLGPLGDLQGTSPGRRVPAGYYFLVTFCLILVTRYVSFVTRYYLLVTLYFTFHSSLLIRYSLLLTRCFCSLVSTMYLLNSGN